jgi:hypothetical protein
MLLEQEENPMIRIRSRLAAPVVAAALLGFAAPAALADDDDRPIAPEEIERVKSSLEGKGYTDVHDIEIDDGRYEVDARNAEGHSVDLELDLQSLEILHEKRD